MMKRFITGLLILIVGIGGVFAVDPVGFDVYTEVTGINLMKITTAEFTGTTKSAFTAAEVYEGNDTKGNHKVTA